MIPKIALIALACSLPLAARAADVYRWVDEAGKTHYGDIVPDKYKQTAKKVGVQDVETSEAQRRETADRVAREKAKVEALQREREGRAGPEPSASPSPAPQAGSECEEQMQKYQASQECFAPYRLANGAIKPEAFDKCQAVSQPTGCSGPSAPADRTYMPPPQ
ncbi:MAG TPA: DUF4124 domain-containing protein [Burkholderiales bacterium]|nr:DUF4124 domain-containing protein [Burkholderiales bacterium]